MNYDFEVNKSTIPVTNTINRSFKYKKFLRYQWMKLHNASYYILPAVLFALIFFLSCSSLKKDQLLAGVQSQNLYFKEVLSGQVMQDVDYFMVLEIDTILQKGIFYFYNPEAYFHDPLDTRTIFAMIGFQYEDEGARNVFEKQAGYIKFAPEYYVYKTTDKDTIINESHPEFFPYIEPLARAYKFEIRDEKDLLDKNNYELIYSFSHNPDTKKSYLFMSNSEDKRWKYYTILRMLNIQLPLSMDKINKVNWKVIPRNMHSVIEEYREKYFNNEYK